VEEKLSGRSEGDAWLEDVVAGAQLGFRLFAKSAAND
jgi:hypothetical protein